MKKSTKIMISIAAIVITACWPVLLIIYPIQCLSLISIGITSLCLAPGPKLTDEDKYWLNKR